MECGKCNSDLGDAKARKAFICMEVMGDEYIYSYWQCDACGFYTLETFRDRIMGTEIITKGGPIDREEGDAVVARIKQCPDPGNKRCMCRTHRSMGPKTEFTPPSARVTRVNRSEEDSSDINRIVGKRKSESLLIKCPICSLPTDSLKRYGVMCEVVFLGIAARSRRCGYTACPKCMRGRVLKDTFSPVNILLANLMWVLAVLPYSLALVVASTVPGHSRTVNDL